MRVYLTTKGPTLAACLKCVTGRQRAIRCAGEVDGIDRAYLKRAGYQCRWTANALSG
jgi:hypothetical protein